MRKLIGASLIGFMITGVATAQTGGSGGTGSGQAPGGTATPPTGQRTVNPQTNQGAVNPNTNQGAVNPNTNQGAVNPNTNQGVVNPNGTTTTTTPFALGGITQTPWFSDPMVQSQLKLTPDQISRLNQLYAQDFQRFTTSTSNVPLANDQQQQQRMQQLTDSFITNFTNASNSILTPDQRTRFAQLWMQSRGFSVFSDPQMQSRLQLTPQQMQSIRQLQQQYDQAVANNRQLSASDPTAAASQLAALRSDFNNKLIGLFTDNQRQIWNQMVGDPFTFTIR